MIDEFLISALIAKQGAELLGQKLIGLLFATGELENVGH
jgi:hypothetical protein